MSGFSLSRTHSQGDVTGKQFLYDVDAAHATLLAPGDVMRITGTATADPSGRPQIDSAAAGQSVTGVLFSVTPNFSGEALSETGLPASTGGSVQVNVDPHALYEVDVSNGPLTVDQVGLNADILATAASTFGGLSISNMTLNASTAATTQTLQFRIVALLTSDAGVFGDRALVRINNTTVSDGAAGV